MKGGAVMELMELARQAEPILREAGELVRSMAHPKVYTKEGHANFVTEADLASQKFLLERLSPLVPGAHFFAEEQKQNRMEPGYNWVIDPIDGTTNFMRGYRPSAISVGLVEDGQGVLGLVLDPWSGELFCGVKGQGAFCNGEPIRAAQVPMENAIVVFGTTPYRRDLAAPTFQVVEEIFLRCGDVRRSGSAALDLCYVAAGRCDGFFEGRLSPWDYAAASVILREAGARIGPSLGFEEPQLILAGSGAVYQALAEIVREKWSYDRV